MSLTNEDLLAISQLLDVKLKAELQPIKEEVSNIKEEVSNIKEEVSNIKEEVSNIKTEIHNIKLFQENVILPRLDTIESCYIDTYKRYVIYTDKMETAFSDIELLKKTVAEHSEKLNHIA